MLGRPSLALMIFLTVLSPLAVAEELEVRAGIDGRYRIGRWMPLHIRGAAAGSSVEIATLDGDGVRIVQRAQVPAAGDPARGFHRYVQAGPMGSPLEVRRLAAAEGDASAEGEGATTRAWRIRIGEGAVAVSRPWVVAIGDPLGLDMIGRNELLGLPGSVAVSRPTDVAELPSEWFGYDGVQWVVVNGAGIDLLAAMDSNQQRALAEWVRGGGRLLLALGASGPETLAAAPWLGELAGIEGPGELVQAEPVAVEVHVGATAPIDSFTALRLPGDAGTILWGTTQDRQRLPLILRHDAGLGAITVVAADLHAAPFQDWKHRDDFIQRVVPNLIPDRNQRGDVRPAGDVRYSEMAGQLRSTLDRFPDASSVRFSLIAAMLLAAIGLIGPLDFFVVNRWLGRPLLGWLTFPITIVGFSAVILLWRGTVPERRVNQVTVIDVDPASGVGRGFTWGQVFTGQADRLDLDYLAEGAVSRLPQGRTLCAPWGYAGNVFGGIEVAGEEARLPPYAIDFKSAGDAQRVESSLRSVPLAPLSSKGIAAWWRFPGEMPVDSQLSRRTGSDLLTGTFVNPLPVDVLDAVLVYRNTAFLLPTRVPAGSRISAVETLQAKNFRWRLNRRRTAETSSQSEPWNPADDQDLSRLMEIVLFYEAAGGASYTGLDNRMLADLDLTDALTSSRAMLVGRLHDSEAILRIDGQTLAPSQTEATTYVRVMLPVEVSSRNP